MTVFSGSQLVLTDLGYLAFEGSVDYFRESYSFDGVFTDENGEEIELDIDGDELASLLGLNENDYEVDALDEVYDLSDN